MIIEQKRIITKKRTGSFVKRSIIILSDVEYITDQAEIERWCSRHIQSSYRAIVSKKLRDNRLALGFDEPSEARKFVRWVESPKRVS